MNVAAAAVVGVACSGGSTTSRPGGSTRVPSTPVATAQLAERCAPPYPTAPIKAETVYCADPATMEPARVVRIVDGDTLHVELDGRDETIRLYGVDTPERGEPCFAEATEALRGFGGAEVRLRRDARDRDRYGRLLRYVYAPDGRSVDAKLVAAGVAHAWTSDGALKRPLIELEDSARVAHIGCLWR